MRNRGSQSNFKYQRRYRGVEILKWILAVILLMIAIMSNHYQNIRLVIRILTVIITILTAVFIVSLTKNGKVLLNFFLESQQEMRRIIWPSKQETLHTTLIVVTATAIMSLILWGLDRILFFIISFLTNVRF
ncbi:MAG: preprotein translocase subunit SecE [Candidatus Dasytiphilus stammeri]